MTGIDGAEVVNTNRHSEIHTLGTGVTTLCWAPPKPYKSPLPILVFICPPVLLSSRRSKGKCLFWFRVTA